MILFAFLAELVAQTQQQAAEALAGLGSQLEAWRKHQGCVGSPDEHLLQFLNQIFAAESKKNSSKRAGVRTSTGCNGDSTKPDPERTGTSFPSTLCSTSPARARTTA
jgi:hypothetical protein